MRSPGLTFRSSVAASLSIWLAFVACLMGCTLPAFAGSAPNLAATTESQPSPQADLMADMLDCPHHHPANDSPAKPKDGKPVHGGAMSCCPVEITVGQKWDAAALGIVPVVAVMSPGRRFGKPRTFTLQLEIEAPIRHSRQRSYPRNTPPLNRESTSECFFGLSR